MRIGTYVSLDLPRATWLGWLRYSKVVTAGVVCGQAGTTLSAYNSVPTAPRYRASASSLRFLSPGLDAYLDAY